MRTECKKFGGFYKCLQQCFDHIKGNTSRPQNPLMNLVKPDLELCQSFEKLLDRIGKTLMGKCSRKNEYKFFELLLYVD